MTLFGSLKFKIDLFHTLLQEIISLVKALLI
jgi:hypothetical protein